MATSGGPGSKTYVYPVFVTVELGGGAGETQVRGIIGRAFRAALGKVAGATTVDVLPGVPADAGEQIRRDVLAALPPGPATVGPPGTNEDPPG